MHLKDFKFKLVQLEFELVAVWFTDVTHTRVLFCLSTHCFLLLLYQSIEMFIIVISPVAHLMQIIYTSMVTAQIGTCG